MMIAPAAISSVKENRSMIIGGGLKQSLSNLGAHVQSIWSDIAKKGLLIMSLKYSAFEGHMGVTLASAGHVQCLACEVFDAPERLPSMSIQNLIKGLRVWASLSALVLLLCGGA